MATILITGANRGIGLALVQAYLKRGDSVIGVCRNSSEALKRSGAEVIEQVDVSQQDDLDKLHSQLGGRTIDVLINNAGISPKSPDNGRLDTINTSLDCWQQVFQVNFFAPMLLAKNLKETLAEGSGSIVNVTSIAGSRVHEFAGSAYATSKAALSALTREMAADFGPYGIRVNAIAPGEIKTDIISPESEKLIAPKIPLGRFGTPEEVAQTIYFLCSDMSHYLNGSEIHVNGGQHV